MFRSLWNSRRRQQALVARPQLAIAARNPPVPGRACLRRKSLPSRSFAQRANLCGHLNSVQSHQLHLSNSLPDFAPLPPLPASGNNPTPVYKLWSRVPTCAGLRKTPLHSSKPASAAPIRDGGVQNRLPAPIFTVDIRSGERRIRCVRFPDSDISSCPPGTVLGMHAHRYKRICIRKRPARRNNL
jgi:hypothetical protein